MRIFAVDSATITGWATLIDGVIESGSVDFTVKKEESRGMLFLKFNRWLDEMYGFAQHIGADGELRSYDLIVYEQAHYRGKSATLICTGLTTRLMEFAVKIGAECVGAHSGTLKKFATGSGKASKEDIMAWFKEQTGRDPVDDNEADAYCLLRYAMNEYMA